MMKYWSFASEPIDSVMETSKRWTVTSVTDDDPWMPRLAPSLSARSPAIFALLLSSHSVPCRREVKVQLLDPGPLQSSSQDTVCVAGVQMEERLSSGCLGNNTNTTAAHQIKVEFSSLRQTAVLVTAVLTSVLVMQYFVCRGRSVCIAVLQTLCLCVSVSRTLLDATTRCPHYPPYYPKWFFVFCEWIPQYHLQPAHMEQIKA